MTQPEKAPSAAESLPRLLLVDDEPNVIEGLMRRLRRQYQIFFAHDGAQALKVLEQQGDDAHHRLGHAHAGHERSGPARRRVQTVPGHGADPADRTARPPSITGTTCAF